MGALAQLGERLLCKHQVIGSIPIGSTIRCANGSLISDCCISGDSRPREPSVRRRAHRVWLTKYPGMKSKRSGLAGMERKLQLFDIVNGF